MQLPLTIVIGVHVAVVLIFAVQNLQSITVSFVTLKVSAPISVFVALSYVLVMVTGGSL